MKKFFKFFGIILLAGVIMICGLDAYTVLKPEFDSKKKVEGISEVATSIDNLTLDENVEIVGLGEASHGNKEFQELKLDVLKKLVNDYSVNTFAMEMDYGEGCFINDYISGVSDLSLEEIMDIISFDIYKTEQIKELIQWMREYNFQTDEQLFFYGFDMQNPDKDLMYINSYLNSYCNMTDSSKPTIISYINGDVTFREAGDKLFNELQMIEDELVNNGDIYVEYGDYDRVLTCIENVKLAKNLSDNGNDSVAYGTIRDEQMTNNVIDIYKHAVNHGGKVMLAGHNGHVGYAGSYVTTMGKHLKDTFNDSYYVIGTDYYKTTCNIKGQNNERGNHYFVSADILAYQAKELGTYLLQFSKVKEDSPVYDYIHGPIYTGSLGESYSILNKLLSNTVRIYCEPEYLYDAMILVYEATPLELLNN